MLGVICILDILVLRVMPHKAAGMLQIVFLIAGALLVCGSVYAFALQARFVNTVKNTLKNALILIFARLPYTVLIMVITIGPVIATFLTIRTILIGITLWFFIGVSLVAWLNSFLLRHIFQKLEEVQTQGE